VRAGESFKYLHYTLQDTRYNGCEVNGMEEECCKEEMGKEKMKCVIKMHCPEGEDAEKIKEKVLMKLSEKLEGRCNVVMTRLNDDDLEQIDSLVEVDVFKSRSEAAAFFIKEGMQARKDLFQKVMSTVEKIRELKEQAKKSLGENETQ